MSLTNLFQKYLEQEGISATKFAKLLGVNPSTVYGWHKGGMSPRPAMAWKIHTLTKGRVPISYWGYEVRQGKLFKPKAEIKGLPARAQFRKD
jgi:transcriptional regulator with XRE-family HTH domain